MSEYRRKKFDILIIYRMAAIIILFTCFFLLKSRSVYAASPIKTDFPEKITIAYNVGNPPLKFNNQGNADGILIDIWRLWSEKTGVKVEFKEAVFAHTLEMVKDGRADVHAGLFYTKERDRIFDYTSSIIDTDYFIYYHESISGIGKLEDLFPFRIGVPQGFTHTFIKQNLPNAAISVYENLPKLFEAAVTGEIKVLISPVMNHDYFFQLKNKRSPFRYIPRQPAYSRTYFGAVRQGNSDLLAAVNQGFSKISFDEIIEIQRKWLKGNKVNQEKQSYIIACDSNYAPLTMINAKGRPAGLFVDVWKHWAQTQDVNIKFIFNNWEGSIQAVKQGLADFHSGFENDEKIFVSSQPFYELSAKIFILFEKKYSRINDLAGRTIASIDPYYARVLKNKNPAIQIIIAKDFTQIFKMFNRGEIDGFIDDELVVENLLLRQGRQGEFKKITDFSYQSSISAVTLKKNSHLLNSINQGLGLMSDQMNKTIETKWLSEPLNGYYHTYKTRVLLTKKEQEWLNSHKVFRLGVDPDYHPYEFVDEQGRYSGAASDYMQLIEKRLGIELNVVKDLTWQQVMDLSRNKDLDVVAALTKTPERSQFLNFTRAYLGYPIVIVTQKDYPELNGLAGLSGKKVALVKDYAYTELLLARQPDVDRIFVDTVYQGLEMVASGKAAAIAGDLASLAYQIQKNNLINLKINSQTALKTKGLAIGVPKDNSMLVSILDKALASITPEEHLNIRQKWVSLESPASKTAEQGTAITKKIKLTKKEKEFIKAHPVIRIGADPKFIPFEFINEKGIYSGIASAYVGLLNERLGINMQIVPDLSWYEVVEKAKQKQIDVLPCVGVTRERLGFLHYSKSYARRYLVIITRNDAPLILTMEDLADKKVAVEENTFQEGFIIDNTSIEPIRYQSFQKALHAVSAGKADALIADVSTATFWIKKLNLTNLKVAAPASYEAQPLHFAVRKDWPELVQIINKGLASITPKEDNKIRSKWILVEYELGMNPADLWKYIGRTILGGLVVLSIFLLWNYSLKKEINERKKAEKKIQEYARELKNTNINLESLDKLKSMFIASMSHELRTPLNSIIGFTGVILQGMTGDLNEQQKDQLGRVYKSAKHLLNLISDVIDISKVEAGRIDVFLEEFNLAEVVDEAVVNIEPQLKIKGLDLEVDVKPDIIIISDRKRLLQCLINYLSNAVKYTEKGSVHLVVKEVETDIEIWVSDTGIGIAPDDIPKLFTAFERMNTHLKIKAGGTGLGLYLTRKLVTEILNGTIMVESQLEKGSTFGLRIPKKLDKSEREK